MAGKKGIPFSSLAPASAERLPDTADGKTSKYKSKHATSYGGMYTGAVNQAILPAKKVTERTYRGYTVPVPVTDTTVYTEIAYGKSYVDAPASAIKWRKGRAIFERLYTARNPLRARITRKVAVSAHVSVPTVTQEVTAQASPLMLVDGKLVRATFEKHITQEGEDRVVSVPCPAVAGDTYLHTVVNVQVNRVTTVQKADSFHKPILSARSAAEAKFYADLLNKSNPTVYVRETNAHGLTVRERYAESLGVDLSILRGRLAKFERQLKVRVEGVFLTEKQFREKCNEWYNAELEHKISVMENPDLKKDRDRAELRKTRRAAHEFNRQQNLLAEGE